jgi:hypothetical protein
MFLHLGYFFFARFFPRSLVESLELLAAPFCLFALLALAFLLGFLALLFINNTTLIQS